MYDETPESLLEKFVWNGDDRNVADVYVNDAFGAAHRAHASVSALPRMVGERGAGLLLEKEIQALSALRERPGRPYVAVLGGAKVSDKIGVLEALLTRVDALLVGGAMANTFLAAQGKSMGGSLVEDDKLPLARSLIDRAGDKLVLPVDLRLGDGLDATVAETWETDGVPADRLALDIGPETAKHYAERVRKAESVFWNGPMGLFENPTFAAGSVAVAEAIAIANGEMELEDEDPDDADDAAVRDQLDGFGGSADKVVETTNQVPEPESFVNVASAVSSVGARPGRSAGRVKTRLLGFQPGDEVEKDIFESAKENEGPVATEFPVGWIVVVDGPGRGKCFTIYNGASSIGRGEDQAVRLDFGDNSISRNNHAAVAFDDEEGTFFLGHGGKSNLVRLNGKPVLSTEELNKGDQVRIGETTLLFMPLCGEDFSWNDKNDNDQDDNA